MEGMEDLRHIQHLVETSPSPSYSPGTAAHQLHQHQAQHRHTHDHVAGGATDNLDGEDVNHARKGTTTDAVASLQLLLDRTPITPLLNGSDGDGAAESHHRVPGGGGMLDLDPELELEQEDTVRQAIVLLHCNGVQGAPIVDGQDSISSIASVTGGFRDRGLGFLHLSALILWCLEEMNNTSLESGSSVCCTGDFLHALQQQAPKVAQTKMIELAARSSVLWEPFFPVSSEETLLHVLLLFAKHPRLSVVPVTQHRISSSPRRIITYVSQKAVVQFLLQSSGLNWFDQIADKRLSDFRFRDIRRNVTCIDSQQSVADGFHTLWTNEADVLPVVAERDGGKRKLVGSLTRNHVLLLLEDDSLFNNRRKMTVNDFMTMTQKRNNLTSGKESRKKFQFTISTNHGSDLLKQAMSNLISTDSGVSFLVEVDGAGDEVVVGSITLKDAIVQFSPPSSDTSVAGFDFFESALEDTGCSVENGVMVCESAMP